MPDKNPISGVEPLNLAGLSSIPIAQRKNLVTRGAFATVADPQGSIRELLASFPEILAGSEFRAAVRSTVNSVKRGNPVVFAMGGHVVKVGMAPLLIDLMERGVIHALVMNGATAIHDYEIALIGETSEDVGANIQDGSFGMARETAAAFAQAAALSTRGVGLGRALGELINAGDQDAGDHPHADVSLLAAAARLGIPTTVHVAMGTDVVHMHPEMDGAELGRSTHLDFCTLAAIAQQLAGGTWVNIGSAVILPEVFLKVISMARNLGYPLKGLTAINFDMLSHYRTSVNVLSRPVERGISILGHHELMLPLFRVALLLELGS